MRFDAFAHGFHDFQIDPEQIVPAHARLARHASCDDTHISASDIGIIIRTFEID